MAQAAYDVAVNNLLKSREDRRMIESATDALTNELNRLSGDIRRRTRELEERYLETSPARELQAAIDKLDGDIGEARKAGRDADVTALTQKRLELRSKLTAGKVAAVAADPEVRTMRDRLSELPSLIAAGKEKQVAAREAVVAAMSAYEEAKLKLNAATEAASYAADPIAAHLQRGEVAVGMSFGVVKSLCGKGTLKQSAATETATSYDHFWSYDGERSSCTIMIDNASQKVIAIFGNPKIRE